MKMDCYSIEYGVKSNLLPHVLTNHMEGKVHSVFQTSFNIKIGQSLVHFGPLGTPLSSFGINVPKRVLSFLLNHAMVGDFVKYTDDKIFIFTSAYQFVIHLDMFAMLDLRIKKLAIDQKQLKNNEIYKLIHLIDYEKLSGILRTNEDRMMIHKLMESPLNQKELIKTIIKYFYGRGIGLTPSGDDFLSGIIMVESFLTNNTLWKDGLKQQLREHETSDVSFSYYTCLLEGFVSENFLNLFCNFNVDVDINKAKRLVKNITDYGHTSGIDTLFGIIIALKLI